MKKKILINNAIALAVYGLTVVAYVSNSSYNLARIIAPNVNHNIVEGCIAAFLYVLCGFLLMPVNKLSFLSVASVMIALFIVLFICGLLGELGFAYYGLNTLIDPLLQFDFLKSNHSTVVSLSPVCPSLLMYLGVLIRKLVIRLFHSKTPPPD